MKHCDTCGVEIPEEYQNLLCDSCYRAEEVKTPPEPILSQEQGILDPNYIENPEKDDKEQWATNLMQFDRSGFLLWHPTREMYEYIKTFCLNKVTQHPQYPKYIWKPKIVDVGCGIGVGSNVVSQESDFTWGIDKNENSVKFASQAFSRVKNGIYYSTQVTFDQVDIMTDTREFQKFDIVLAIEIIEHLQDARKFLQTLIKKFDKHSKQDQTIYFISTPNRNNEHISKIQPGNKFHIREWTSFEMYSMLQQYFQNIELLNSKGEPIPKNEYETTTITPILYQCSLPKV